MERETGFEPATSTLARSHSTTELFPPLPLIILRSAGGPRQPGSTRAERRCSARAAARQLAPGRVASRRILIDLRRSSIVERSGRRSQVVKAEVCKTSTLRFKSGRRLQLNLLICGTFREFLGCLRTL